MQKYIDSNFEYNNRINPISFDELQKLIYRFFTLDRIKSILNDPNFSYGEIFSIGGSLKTNLKIKKYRAYLKKFTIEKLKKIAKNKKITIKATATKSSIITKLVKNKYS